MQASLYRRNYYLAKVNDQNLILQKDKKQKEMQEQSAAVINEMITHTKTLLLKCNIFKNQMETAEDIETFQNKVVKFKQYQKTIPLTFSARSPLDARMSGAFVMHVCKQMTYWNSNLPFLKETIDEVDKLFQLQKKTSDINISLLYTICIKNILKKINELEKQIKNRFQQQQEKSSDEGLESDIFLVPCFHKFVNYDAAKKVKWQLEEQMRKLLSLQYRGLDIEEIEAVTKYVGELMEQENSGSLFKKQIKRNKNIKKQIKQYKLVYEEHLLKKERERKRKEIKTQKKGHNSVTISLKDKKPVKIIHSLNNSSEKHAKHVKLSFPSLPISKFNDIDTKTNSKQTKYRSLGKQNRRIEVKSSVCDLKKSSNKLKLKRNELKLRL